MIPRLLRTGVAAAAIVATAMILPWIVAQRLLERQELLSARRLQKTTSCLIERAHHVKDDLTIQGTVQSLGEAPGVLFACVVNEQGRILAHNQPSRLGQTLKLATGVSGTWACSLEEGNKPWGRLVFRMSQVGFLAMRLKFMMVLALAATALVGAFLAAATRWQSCLARAKCEKDELSALLEEESKKVQRAQEDQEAAARRWSAWLLSALEQIPRPLLLLDERQRVVALNRWAAGYLGISDLNSLLGRSWQDIHGLRECGQSLAQSLDHPKQTVQLTVGPARRPLELLTLASDGGTAAGTWVLLFEISG